MSSTGALSLTNAGRILNSNIPNSKTLNTMYVGEKIIAHLRTKCMMENKMWHKRRD
jgi:hypothetical protein